MNAPDPAAVALLDAPAPAVAGDTITILRSAGPVLTKTFDGEREIPYDLAKHFTVETRAVANLRALSSLLTRLTGHPQRCIIRGRWVGDEAAQAIVPAATSGRYPRTNALFTEVPHHWVMLDIDRYEPLISDPVADPEAAIDEFIHDVLPEPFRCASYHWQLSASAGRTPGVLKCHLWFWLEQAYTGPQLKAWVRAGGLPIDVAPLRRVQVHYTANPVFLGGARDPVAQRCGLHQGARDTVELIIDPAVLDQAEQDTHEGSVADLPDPTEKPGLIGAFCRAYPISRVLAELLPEEFELAPGSSRRVTWRNSGGGAPEGCFTTEDDWYLGNTHNSDPFDGRLANAWDLVRVFRFGARDRTLSEDERALASVTELPSHQAMLQWAAGLGLPLVEDAGPVATEAVSARDGLLEQIREVSDEAALRDRVLPAIAAADLSRTDLDVLALALQARMTQFTGVRVTLPMARAMLRNAGRTPSGRRVPFWAAQFCYIGNGDYFYNLDNKEKLTRQGFDLNFGRFMPAYMDEDGNVPSASKHAADVWQIPCAANVAYNPTLGPLFELGGQSFANSYCEQNLPGTAEPPDFDGELVIELFEAHTRLILPQEQERRAFLDWIAHNVQHPGRKIRWSPFLHGLPGAGKTLYAQLLSAAMGPDNVKPINATTILTSQFNEWANGAAVGCIEEIRVPDHSAREAENKLKAPVSNSTIEIHPKGAKPFVVVNVTNYLILSNFADGLPMDETDRRYLVLRAALGKEEILALSASGHYKRLFEGLEKHAGALRWWLLHRELSPEFDPDGHAPWTAEKARVVELCRSDLHNALTDLLTDGGRGISRHVISVPHLVQKLVERTGEKVFTRTLNKLLTDAGYTERRRVFWDKSQHRVAVHELFVYPAGESEKETNKRLAKILEATLDENGLD